MALHELAVMKQLFPPLEGIEAYESELTGLVARANSRLPNLVEDAVEAAEQGLVLRNQECMLEALKAD